MDFKALIASAILASPLGVLLYADPDMAKVAVLVCALAFAVAVGVAIAAVIVRGINAVRGIRRPPAPPAVLSAQISAGPPRAEFWGLDAVTRALRPISLPRRRVLNETEADAWSELARAFDDEHKQQGWR